MPATSRRTRPCAPSGIRRGMAVPRNWQGRSRAVDAFDAKADALAVLDAAGAPVATVQIVAEAPAWYHPGPLRHDPDGTAEQARDIRRNPSARACGDGCEGPARRIRGRAHGDPGGRRQRVRRARRSMPPISWRSIAISPSWSMMPSRPTSSSRRPRVPTRRSSAMSSVFDRLRWRSARRGQEVARHRSDAQSAREDADR